MIGKIYSLHAVIRLIFFRLKSCLVSFFEPSIDIPRAGHCLNMGHFQISLYTVSIFFIIYLFKMRFQLVEITSADVGKAHWLHASV